MGCVEQLVWTGLELKENRIGIVWKMEYEVVGVVSHLELRIVVMEEESDFPSSMTTVQRWYLTLSRCWSSFLFIYIFLGIDGCSIDF